MLAYTCDDCYKNTAHQNVSISEYYAVRVHDGSFKWEKQGKMILKGYIEFFLISSELIVWELLGIFDII